MALSSSFQSQGAIPKAISSVKNYLSPSNTQGFFGSPTSSVSKPTTTPSLGTNPGVINPPTAPVKSTVDRTGTTTNYSTKPNPSVLEQQKALNKLGAGLVEDGITGPKTREAIAKFGNTTTPTTNPTTAPKVETPPPAPLTVAGQTPGLLKTGQQTGNEAETQKKVEEAGAITQWENDVRNGMAVEEANKRLTDFRTAVAKKYADIESQAIPLEFQQGRAGALARQFASQESALQQGVANALTNQGQQFGAAQAQASRGAATAGQAFTGAQTQAQRATGTYGTALGAIAPTYGVPFGTQVGQPGLPNAGVDTTAYGGGPAASANVQSIKDLTGQKNQIQSVFNGAEANFALLVDTAKQGGVNDTNVPAINALQQAVAKGLTSSSAVINFQNTLASVRSQYAQILGGGTATVDSQQRAEEAIPPTISLGALQSLEQQLKAEANNRIGGITQQINTLSKPTGSSTGGFSWDALNQ